MNYKNSKDPKDSKDLKDAKPNTNFYHLVRLVSREFGDVEIYLVKTIDEIHNAISTLKQYELNLDDDPDEDLQIVVSLVKNNELWHSILVVPTMINQCLTNLFKTAGLDMTSLENLESSKSLADLKSVKKSNILPMFSNKSEESKCLEDIKNSPEYPISIKHFYNFLSDKSDRQLCTLTLYTAVSTYFNEFGLIERDEFPEEEESNE